MTDSAAAIARPLRPYAGVSFWVHAAIVGWLLLPGLLLVAGTLWWLALLLWIPAAAVIGFWLFGRALLVAASWRWGTQGIRGVLVTSDSPLWADHIRTQWVPAFGGRLLQLDGASPDAWPTNLATSLWRHYCGHYRVGTGPYQNVVPAVIVLRGLRHPLVFRFRAPFEEAQRGRPEPLRQLENALRAELEAPAR